jgi:hypothetical protein
MAGLKKNLKYNDLFLEAQKTVVTKDPYGKRYVIYQGMQFRFDSYEDLLVGCGCDGKPKTPLRYFYINALATCVEGTYLWPTRSGSGMQLAVTEENFIETESLKYPPVKGLFVDELSGKDTNLFTEPWKREIPRDGVLWYTDPWLSQRDA